MAANSRRFIFIATCFLVSYTQVQEVIAQDSVSPQCLQCICQAASGCDTLTGCKGDVCGPYRITEPYWCDSGKPGNDGNSADGGFGRCVGDQSCAAQAVQGYMKRYARDCNGDGVVDCDDYVHIHRLGPVACGGALPADYQNAYSTCMGGGSAQPGGAMQPVAYAQPMAYAQPAEHPQPVAYAQPAEHPQPVAYAQPAEHPQPMAYAQPAQHPQPVAYAQPNGHAQPTGHAQPDGWMQSAGGVQQGVGMHPGVHNSCG